MDLEKVKIKYQLCLNTWTLDPRGGHWPLPSFMVSISTPMAARCSKYLQFYKTFELNVFMLLHIVFSVVFVQR